MITKNLIKLIDGICDNFNNALEGKPWHPHMDGQVLVTYCNYFVHGVCHSMGYKEFTHQGKTVPMLANEMIDFMKLPYNGWMTVGGDTAQYHANSGVLVVAGQKADGHGHVCMVRPGEFQFSPHWGKKSPRVANVGKQVFINNSASWAFQDEPEFFILKEMV